MITETLILKEIVLLPELFLGISLLYIVIHGIFLSVNKNYPLLQTSVIYLSILVLIMVCCLLINDGFEITEYSVFNNTITNDYLSFASKFLIGISCIFCLLVIQKYLVVQKINHFEYILIFLFAILGIFLLCSSNDLITTYLAIELQSLAFYVLATFKKNSTFSVDAGLKYFILGAFSSSLLLFGSSIVYGVTGTTNFEDFKDLYFWIFPGSIAALSDIDNYYQNQNQTVLLYAIAQKLATYHNCYISENDFNVIDYEMINFKTNKSDADKVDAYGYISSGIFHALKDYFMWERPIPKELSYENSLFIKKVWFITDFFQNDLHDLISGTEQIDGKFIFENNDDLKTLLELKACLCFLNISERLYMCVKLNDYQENVYFYNFFDANLLQFALIFIMISLFFKIALAPFHLWSPDVYEGSLTSSTFFFAVIPKLSIFVLLIRIFYYSFYGFIDNWRYYIVVISIITIIVGSFAGLEQRKLKSLLAYSSISHMGYLLIAFSTGTFEGIQMLLCYLIVYMNSGLCIWSIFLLTRLKNNYYKKQNKDLTDFVLLKKSNKMLALFLTTVLLSIAGFPPMIGFFVKIGVFLVSIEASMYFVALFSILCSVISTFYYIRIIKILFFEKVLTGKLYYPITTQKVFIVPLLFYFLIFLFINPTLLYLFSYKIGII